MTNHPQHIKVSIDKSDPVLVKYFENSGAVVTLGLGDRPLRALQSCPNITLVEYKDAATYQQATHKGDVACIIIGVDAFDVSDISELKEICRSRAQFPHVIAVASTIPKNFADYILREGADHFMTEASLSSAIDILIDRSVTEVR